LAEAIALQVGVALIQAEAYQHLEDLNHQLEALDQAKSDLIAVTGHELRTPLSTIQICLETLSTDPDMPLELRQEMLDTALQDADRLRRLVQDFLTLSKLESGRIQWHIEAISAEECIELALSNITARRRREILPGITLEMPDRLLMVKADGEWLVEVLQKLLDNACKFTPATGDICLRLQSVDRRQASKQVSQMLNPFGGESTQFVQFTISDTGRGIDPLRLEQIFARFYQAEGSLRRSVGGTGLGLAISRFIIEGMGGVIWAESLGKDQGSTFHFLLPAVAAGATDRQDPLLSSRR
jgi:signal transduction histidine kinase